MRKNKLLTATLPLLLASGLLAGCAEGENPPVVFTHAKWKQVPEPIQPQAEPITVDHQIPFNTSQAQLSGAARSGINAFLNQAQIAQGDRIEIDGPRNDSGRHTPLTAARLAAVKSELERKGFSAVISDNADSASIYPDQVRLSVTRVMVVHLDCGQDQPDRGYRPHYNLSCANAANLGMMVANPEDLNRGQPLGPSDAYTTARAVDRYRKGSVTTLQEEATN